MDEKRAARILGSMLPFQMHSLRRIFLDPFPLKPAVLLTFALVPLFGYLLMHHDFAAIVILLLPLAVFIFLGSYIFMGHLSQTITKRKNRMAIIASVVLVAFIFFLQPHLFLYLILYLVWLFVQYSLGRSAVLYTGYSGLVIFAFMLMMHRVMIVEEFLYMQAGNMIRIWSSETGEAKIEWDRPDPGKNAYRISRDSRTLLIVSVPEGMFFHGPERKKPGFEHPEPGLPVAFISSSIRDPEMEPSVSIFELDPRRDYRPTDFLGDFRMFLGYRAGIKEIVDLKYIGASHFEIGGLPAEGIFWSYRSSEGEFRKTGIYIIKTHSGHRFALIVKDIPVEGFPHNPDLLYVLGKMALS